MGRSAAAAVVGVAEEVRALVDRLYFLALARLAPACEALSGILIVGVK